MLRRKKAETTTPEPVQEAPEEKILEVTASMTGTLTFKDPVNLHIKGSFEGFLDTKGTLVVGEDAIIKANIVGETVVIAGRVTGDVTASKSLEIIPPALVLGNITTPIIGIKSGAILEGRLRMTVAGEAWEVGPGDEVFIPRQAVHSVVNIHGGTPRWLYGYD